MPRKSWGEKLACNATAEVKVAPKDFADIKAGQKMLLTTAQDVAAILKSVRKGQQVDMKMLRSKLANTHDAEIACPVVTGIHLRTVAEAVGEQLDAGAPATKVVPVWRAIGPKAPIWKKLENGRDKLEALRRAENLKD